MYTEMIERSTVREVKLESRSRVKNEVNAHIFQIAEIYIAIECI